MLGYRCLGYQELVLHRLLHSLDNVEMAMRCYQCPLVADVDSHFPLESYCTSVAPAGGEEEAPGVAPVIVLQEQYQPWHQCQLWLLFLAALMMVAPTTASARGV